MKAPGAGGLPRPSSGAELFGSRRHEDDARVLAAAEPRPKRISGIAAPEVLCRPSTATNR